ncbi:hypothetical protein DNL40_08885 [Xylanimonas oleitrophica]|uniref:DUF5808 domain-containing protein n=1 Tax=Xylanimonas oleitrophica TaxID=2607479 RepID=A0A2W5XT02_9MICO|nr:DUF5808 domain-containing protein [Xylanimonas oleitrophica]PZR53108.1 hypothetical protein DNL40_08885 [Xylanimonas oleitrophica]
MGSKKKGGLRKLVTVATAALTVAAVVKELRTPEGQRTWNGKVASVVPYDFRFPTVERIKERLWNPDGDNVISPRVFGVGWTVNAGKVVSVARQKLTS